MHARKLGQRRVGEQLMTCGPDAPCEDTFVLFPPTSVQDCFSTISALMYCHKAASPSEGGHLQATSLSPKPPLPRGGRPIQLAFDDVTMAVIPRSRLARFRFSAPVPHVSRRRAVLCCRSYSKCFGGHDLLAYTHEI